MSQSGLEEKGTDAMWDEEIRSKRLKQKKKTPGNRSRAQEHRKVVRMQPVVFWALVFGCSGGPKAWLCSYSKFSEPEELVPVLKTNAHLGIFVFYPSEASVENRIHFHFLLSTDIVLQLCDSCGVPPHK